MRKGLIVLAAVDDELGCACVVAAQALGMIGGPEAKEAVAYALGFGDLASKDFGSDIGWATIGFTFGQERGEAVILALLDWPHGRFVLLLIAGLGGSHSGVGTGFCAFGSGGWRCPFSPCHRKWLWARPLSYWSRMFGSSPTPPRGPLSTPATISSK